MSQEKSNLNEAHRPITASQFPISEIFFAIFHPGQLLSDLIGYIC
jgi:hypothetical protein